MIFNFLRKYTLPGLKRWFFFVALGLICIAFGLALILKARPITFLANLAWSFMSFIADIFPPTVSGIIAICIGAFVLLFGFFKANKQVLKLVAPDEDSLFEALDRRHMEGKGIKVVVIGGGTGLSNMLAGLKTYTSNITAVVTVADDGGSSGRLRKSMNMVPPGDMRNCIAALAHDDEVITQLFQYRFDKEAPEDLRNHSFGNLFLTALVELGGSKNMSEAAQEACRILRARGVVLPVSNEPMNLVAHMEDGSIVEGESRIPEAQGKIKKLSCKEPCPEVLPEVIEAIHEADLIILGPGSLYTSVIPNLLVPELSQAVASSVATKIYVCNVMTQPGETTSYTVSDHLNSIYRHSGLEEASELVDYVIVNNAMPHKKQLEKYEADNQYPVQIDYNCLKQLKINVYPANLLQKGNLVRHHPRRLSRAIFRIFNKDAYKRQERMEKLAKQAV